MIRSSWKAYSQIYTRGIEKEKELTLSCHCGPSSARQQTAVSVKRLHSPLRILKSLDQLKIKISLLF